MHIIYLLWKRWSGVGSLWDKFQQTSVFIQQLMHNIFIWIFFLHIIYLLWKRWSRVGSLWDGSLGRKVIVRRVHDQLSQLQHQDFQHRCAIFLKILWVWGSFSSASFWRRSKIFCHVLHEGEILFLGFISGLKVMQGGGFFKQYPEM